MKKNNKTIEEKLKNINFTKLTEAESEALWNRISYSITPSPFQLRTKNKTMIPLIIGAMLFVGVGGTVAADSSVPGDFLFPVDRAVENMRLAFSGNANAKAELKAKFSRERLQEVKKIVAKEKAARDENRDKPERQATSTKAQGRVEVGVSTAIDFLNKASLDVKASGNAEASAEIDNVVDELEAMVNDAEVKAFINTSGNKDRVEVRGEDERIRIEIKNDGSLMIKTQTKVDVNASTTASSSLPLKIRIR